MPEYLDPRGHVGMPWGPPIVPKGPERKLKLVPRKRRERATIRPLAETLKLVEERGSVLPDEVPDCPTCKDTGWQEVPFARNTVRRCPKGCSIPLPAHLAPSAIVYNGPREF